MRNTMDLFTNASKALILCTLMCVSQIASSAPKTDTSEFKEGVDYLKIAHTSSFNPKSVIEIYDYLCLHCKNMEAYLQSEDGLKITKHWDFSQEHTVNNGTWYIYAGLKRLGLHNSVGKLYLEMLHTNKDYYLGMFKEFLASYGMVYEDFLRAQNSGTLNDYISLYEINIDDFDRLKENYIAKPFLISNAVDYEQFVKLQINNESEKERASLKALIDKTPKFFMPSFFVSGKYMILDNWRYHQIANYLINNQP